MYNKSIYTYWRIRCSATYGEEQSITLPHKKFFIFHTLRIISLRTASFTPHAEASDSDLVLLSDLNIMPRPPKIHRTSFMSWCPATNGVTVNLARSRNKVAAILRNSKGGFISAKPFSLADSSSLHFLSSAINSVISMVHSSNLILIQFQWDSDFGSASTRMWIASFSDIPAITIGKSSNYSARLLVQDWAGSSAAPGSLTKRQLPLSVFLSLERDKDNLIQDLR
uniref:Uncharacterized protein n=1 Tax=Kalanchoe fedtschenkoi TaxID=63787 RepID=A0A7N0TU69_KALFE